MSAAYPSPAWSPEVRQYHREHYCTCGHHAHAHALAGPGVTLGRCEALRCACASLRLVALEGAPGAR